MSAVRPVAVGAGVAAVVALQAVVMGRAIWGLNAGLLLAFAVWRARPHLDPDARRAVAAVYWPGIALQGAHFAEEWASGFARTLPGFFGYAWSDARFAAFNVAWLAVFVAAGIGLRRGVDLALLPIWFFALVGGIGNGVLHVVAAVARGGYFPGLVTAPALLVVGLLLVRRLGAGVSPARPRSAPG
jgi:Protein of unknown function with HXXEE motif